MNGGRSEIQQRVWREEQKKYMNVCVDGSGEETWATVGLSGGCHRWGWRFWDEPRLHERWVSWGHIPVLHH